ncbi:hypothetical protein L0664_03000 [Octadecabacter sp. G9-8]|uniref:Uncharacterized protein n=1 Tax=Octadecabacter dasysiphoniae TaxID=2909341 RepID=A0ABS9CS19_9RHOB|nr:hypothetical protein [Octadecabacter dasysiphoniae]MCF2870025.1 hypothetical protein [Octadecabacter dasysiphoniae]
MSGIGHNSGRVDEPGKQWRTYAWAKARKALMPRLPIEVVRRRVARAKELGLPYKTYAGLRAASGDDLIGFMFSTNALDVLSKGDAIAAEKARKINELIEARKLALMHKPITAPQVVPPLQAAYAAPAPLAPWNATRNHLRDTFIAAKTPASRMVLVYDTALEGEWADAAHMAGALPAPQFFGDAG